MKYIRTKDEVLSCSRNGEDFETILTDQKGWIRKENIFKQADTIEELCDEFVYFINGMPFVTHKGEIHYVAKGIPVVIYGAIWTDKGLIYVAKMNDKGELELL